jgi:hypothetical protein
MKRNMKIPFLDLRALTLIFLSLPCLLQAQTLMHRYSFVSDASDSVGGFNGTLVAGNNPATISNGLILPGTGTSGTPSGYVSLSNGIVSGYTNGVTVECWVTQNATREWAEVWSFGTSGGTINFGLIPSSSSGNMRVAFTPNGGEIDIDSPGLPSGVEEYLCVTYNPRTTTGNLYLNGALDSGPGNPGTQTLPTNYSPGTFTSTADSNFGRDPFGGDDMFNGTIFELRIWNGPVSQRYITASTLLGPTVLVTNLIPTTNIVTAGPGMVLTGTEQAIVNVVLPQTAGNSVLATSDATNWTSGNTNILTVNSSGLITGVGLGATTVSATVAGVTGTSGSITVTAQTLVHRYSFVSDASDSVGGPAWAGTLQPPTSGAAASISNGLILPGSTGGTVSGYVTLPTGIVLGDNSVTVECWMTQNAARTWAEVWDFGINGGVDTTNFALIPVSPTPNMRGAFEPNNGEDDIVSSVPFPSGQEEYVAVTYNNSTLVGTLSTNGVTAGTFTFPNVTYSPGSYGGAAGTSANYLGADRYGDAQFDGTLYELRIWNGVVTPLYQALSAAAGPSVVITNTTPISLSISNTNTMVANSTQQAGLSGVFPQVAAALPGNVATWVSSNTNVLTVNGSGLITAVGPGGASTTVSATIQGVAATSSLITISDTKPTITSQPMSETLNYGDNASFSVSAVGGGLSYQWYFDGVLISGATNSGLSLTDIMLTNQGSYTVVISNVIGAVTSSVVTLTDAPTLVHRFSFSSLNDEVGTATATLLGGAYLDGLGNVQLPNEGTTSASSFATCVMLSPGILTNSASMTMEVWMTDAASETWAEVVCIGGNTSLYDDAQNGTNYISIIPHGGAHDNLLGAFKNTTEYDVEGPTNVPVPINTPEYIVLSYDAQTATGTLYLNGVLVAINTNIPVTPASLGNTYDNYLGSDLFNDPNFVGSIAEFRVWTGTVSPLYQALSLIAGSGVVITNTQASEISVTVTNGTMLEGTTQPAVLTGIFPQITTPIPNSFAVWRSSNTNILTVDTNGNVTAVGPGGSVGTVTATFEGLMATSEPITNAVIAPYFTEEPTNVSLYTGQTATFVSAALGGQLAYQWSVGGHNIPGATTPTLTLTDIPLSDSGGIYKVTVTNSAGSTNATATLTVSEPSLVHRWSFDVADGSTNVIDSIGGADGTLEGNSYISNNAVQLPDVNTTSTSPNPSFVLFPPGIMAGLNAATIEVWATDVAGKTWAEIYSFGGNTSYYDGATDETNYISFIPTSGDGDMRAAFKIYNEEDVFWPFTTMPLNVEEDVTLTYDNTITTAALYLNGSLVAINTNITISPADLGDTYNNYLGKDEFNDPIFEGSVDELRIYAGPLSPTDIANNHIAGPDTPATPGSPLSSEAMIGIAPSGKNVVLTWTVGSLLQAPSLLGPWTTNTTAVSPYVVPATNAAEFYKIQIYP